MSSYFVWLNRGKAPVTLTLTACLTLTLTLNPILEESLELDIKDEGDLLHRILTLTLIGSR